MCGGSGSDKVSGGSDGGASGTSGSAGGSAGTTGSAGASKSGASGGASGASGATGAGAPDGAAQSGTQEGGTASNASILQYHNHLNRDGFYVDGALTKSVLQGATLHVDSTFTATGISGEVRASPLYVAKSTGGGTFYVVTENNNVYAFDAVTGQATTPMRNLGTGLTKEPCGQAHTVGIRGTPAIDLTTGVIVLDAATGTGGTLTKHTIYGLSLTDLSTKWSLDVSTVTDAKAGAFSPTDENQRGAVLIVGGIAYVAYGGYYGDCGTYHGWVVGVPLANPTTGVKAYATLAGDSGIWAPGGPSSDGTNVYAATGNGGQVNGAWAGAFALLRLQPGPVFSGATTDYWVAVNDTGDEDLGGSGPLLIDPPGGPPLVVQLGKDGNAYMLDRSKALGGTMSPLVTTKVMDDEITCGPASAVLSSGTYVAMVGNNAGSGGHACPNGTSGELVVVTVDPNNAATPITTAWCADPQGGGSPIITTSDGTNDALVWIVGATNRNDGSAGSNQLHAWDLATGSLVVMGSDTLAKVHHFTTPIIVNGRIIVAGDTQLYALKP